MVRQYERYDDNGKLTAICKRPQGVSIPRMGYVSHLLLGVKKGWGHADNLAQRLWGKAKAEELKPYQLTAVINELRAQNKDAGTPL